MYNTYILYFTLEASAFSTNDKSLMLKPRSWAFRTRRDMDTRGGVRDTESCWRERLARATPDEPFPRGSAQSWTPVMETYFMGSRINWTFMSRMLRYGSRLLFTKKSRSVHQKKVFIFRVYGVVYEPRLVRFWYSTKYSQ